MTLRRHSSCLCALSVLARAAMDLLGFETHVIMQTARGLRGGRLCLRKDQVILAWGAFQRFMQLERDRIASGAMWQASQFHGRTQYACRDGSCMAAFHDMVESGGG